MFFIFYLWEHTHCLVLIFEYDFVVEIDFLTPPESPRRSGHKNVIMHAALMWVFNAPEIK